MISIHRYLIHTIVIILLQVLIINNIQVNPLINPYIYILIILVLPFKINKTSLIFIGFLFGLIVDIFSDTYGLHAAATTLLAYVRPNLINLAYNKDSFEDGSYPSIRLMGFLMFILYIFLGTFIHHFSFFLLEVFSFNSFHITISKILLNSVLSSICIILYYLIGFKHKR